MRMIEATAASSAAGIITAVATTIFALGGLIGAFTLFIPMLRTVKTVHKIVNQQRTDMQNYNRALISALKHADIDVPIDQSLPPDD